MIPRIKMVEPMPDYKLKVLFDDGKTVIYNVIAQGFSLRCVRTGKKKALNRRQSSLYFLWK